MDRISSARTGRRPAGLGAGPWIRGLAPGLAAAALGLVLSLRALPPVLSSVGRGSKAAEMLDLEASVSALLSVALLLVGLAWMVSAVRLLRVLQAEARAGSPWAAPEAAARLPRFGALQRWILVGLSGPAIMGLASPFGTLPHVDTTDAEAADETSGETERDDETSAEADAVAERDTAGEVREAVSREQQTAQQSTGQLAQQVEGQAERSDLSPLFGSPVITAAPEASEADDAAASASRVLPAAAAGSAVEQVTVPVTGPTTDSAAKQTAEKAPAAPLSPLFGAPQAAQSEGQAQADGEHVVLRGETLWSIARDSLIQAEGREPEPQEIQQRMVRLIETNRERLPHGPDLIHAGTVLLLPQDSAESGR